MLILAGEITQVKEAIPWVRCASGNFLGELPIGDVGINVWWEKYVKLVVWTSKLSEFANLGSLKTMNFRLEGRGLKKTNLDSLPLKQHMIVEWS